MNDNGFMLFANQRKLVSRMSDVQKGQLLDALFAANDGEDVALDDPLVDTVFMVIRESMERVKAFNAKQKANGSKGGRPITQNNPDKTQNNPTITQIEPKQSLENENENINIFNPPIVPPSGGTDVCVSPSEKPKETYTQEFTVFWQRYPKKVGKDAAFRAWKTKKREGHLPAMPVLLKAIDTALRTDQWQRDGGQYIPNPATWLNQGRWMDEEVQEQQLVPFVPIHRAPPPPELLRPDVKPEINEETRAKIQAMKETLARRKAVAI